MECGPFHQMDIEEVKEVLKRAGVLFTVVIKHEELERHKSEYDDQVNLNPQMSVGTFDPAYIYFDVSESDYEKIVPLVEKYGVGQKSTGDELDGANYICSACRYSQADPGLCPECKKELLAFDDYLTAKSAPQSMAGTIIAVIAFVVIGVFVWFLGRR